MSSLNNARQIPSGTIVMFSGLIANIPDGWAFCNGSNGTPDLRNKFIRCSNTDAGTADNPGDTGGTDDPQPHTLTEGEMPSHTHTIAIQNDPTNKPGSIGATGLLQGGTKTTNATGGGSSHTHGSAGQNMPAYHSLVYIMKL